MAKFDLEISYQILGENMVLRDMTKNFILQFSYLTSVL